MASAASPLRKRRSSREEREARSKRKKESGRPQPSNRHSRREGRRESLRVRSVSELARLVSSGTIHIPKSLVHYMEDKVQLLDQIFTILSPSDVKGMLPDILKGLKMKQVKRLCYEQLKNMDADELKRTIQLAVSDWDVGVNTALMDVLGHEVPSQSNPGSTCSHEEKELRRSEHITEGSSSPGEVSLADAEVKEFVIQVSDVSGDEDGENKNTPALGEAHTMASLTVQSYGLQADQVDVKNEKVNSVVGDSSDEQETRNLSGKISDSGHAAVEEYWDSGYAMDVPEAARLLEMELRKRALESELRRKTQVPIERQVEDECEENAGTKAKLSVQEHREVGGGVDVGKTLELKLRERALQSMLARRERQGSRQCNEL